MALETVVGSLRAYSQLKKGTFQHADQLQAERQKNPELRIQWFYTADGSGYFPRSDGGVDWAITREANNLVLRHLGDEVNSSYKQLVQTGNYRPDNVEALAAKNAEGTVIVDMTKLRLSGNEKNWRYLQIRTKDGFIQTEDGYQAPNEEEQKAKTRLGYTLKTLKMMSDSKQKITETRICVLNPKYVQEEVKNKPESNSLWRVWWLYFFYINSSFNAGGRVVDSSLALRGERAKAPEQAVSQFLVP